MIPLSLTVKAFGPFFEEQVIDFTKLARENLFMISGPTGSGKTTVFDAITFALYGEPSGEVRNSDQFKSDYAKPDDECEVTFRFRSGGEEYTIRRKPKQAYINRKGNASFRPAYAELALPNGTAVAGVREVDETVRDVLKLTREQFRKIVMLPQGEFRKLLNADSSEKQEIFRKLFSTELYNRFTQNLREKENALKTAYNERLLLCRATIQAVSPDDTLPESSVEFGRVSVSLGEELENAKDAYTKAQSEYAQIRKAFEGINLELLAERNAKFDRLDAEEKQLRELKKDEATIASKTELLMKLRLVELFSPLFMRLQDAEKNNQADRLLSEKCDKEAQAADEVLTLALEERLKADAGLAQLPGLQVQADFFRAQQGLLLEKLQKEKRQNTIGETLRQMLQEEKTLTHWEACLTNQEELLALKTQQSSVTSFAQAVRAFFRTEEEFQASKQAYSTAFQQFLSSQAAYLSVQLKAGSPCPVCGSVEHPHPAHTNGDAVTEPELNVLKTAHDSLLERFNKEYRSLSKLFADYAALLPFETVETCLRDRKFLWIALVNEQIQNAVDTVQNSYNAHFSQIAAADELPETLELLREYTEALRQRKTRAETEQALLEQELARVAPQLETGFTLEDILQKQAETVQAIERLRKAAEETAQSAERATVRKEEAHRRMADMRQRLAQNAARLKQLKIEWHASFDKHSNFTEADFYELLPTVTNIGALDCEVTAYQQSRTKTDQIILNLRQELNEKERVALEPLKVRKEALTVELQVQNERMQKLYTVCETLRKALSQLKKHLTELEAVEDTYRNVSELYQVSSGNNPQRLALERYVLSAYFDEVIAKANLRLERITNSRYTLVRRTEKEKGLRASGLDMDIFDVQTGRTRHINTLSGGESFQCALCLALGLSDAIAESSGGIRIDTLFIDEGFGSLDAQSLDAAIACILSLKESGRLVGIISHVEELKEKIPVQLQVIPGTSGSTVRLKLP